MSQYLNVADIVDKTDPQGRTFREINNEKPHNIPIGALVEVKHEEWHGGGACEIMHSRLFVVDHTRDCDGTPLYSLCARPVEKMHPVRITCVFPADNLEWAWPPDMAQRHFFNVQTGLPEQSLKVIEITQAVLDGVGALTWRDE